MRRRLTDLLIIGFWLHSMAALVARDVVPGWFAQAPPSTTSLGWLDREGLEFQYGIFGDNGVRQGTAWTVYQVAGENLSRTDTLELHNVPLARSGETLRVQTVMEFLDETQLDEIEIYIQGIPAPVTLRGARQGPMFAFQLALDGTPAHDFVLPADAAETLCDTIRPFAVLEGLQLGQSWTVHVIDPFSMIGGSVRHRLRTVLVKVTGQEIISLQGQDHRCFVVESEGVRAWVDDRGRALLQEVDLPGLGSIKIREERFQRDRLEPVMRHFDGLKSRRIDH